MFDVRCVLHDRRRNFGRLGHCSSCPRKPRWRFAIVRLLELTLVDNNGHDARLTPRLQTSVEENSLAAYLRAVRKRTLLDPNGKCRNKFSVSTFADHIRHGIIFARAAWKAEWPTLARMSGSSAATGLTRSFGMREA